jgi:hypothetical protein
MYDIPFDRSFLQLSNGIRYVTPSTDPKPELTAKASMAQPVSQPAVYDNGLKFGHRFLVYTLSIGRQEGRKDTRRERKRSAICTLDSPVTGHAGTEEGAG